MHGGCLVVWADELAAVAPEGITGEFDVGREGISTVFDGVVGGAATGIDLGAPGRQWAGDDGLIGAGLKTAVAGATAVGQRTVVGIGGEGDHQFADVAVGAEVGIDEECVFSPPSETGLDCPIFIADGGCVDKGAPLEAGIAGIEGGEKLIE